MTTIAHGFHAAMTTHPGKGDELVALLLEAPSLPHPGCLVFLVGRSASNPDLVFITEGWASPEIHAEFFASDVAKAFTARVAALIAESTYADEIPVGGKAVL